MSFVSYIYTRYDPATEQNTYTIVDSDFGAVEVGVGVGVEVEVEVEVAVAKEYSKRGLPVGRNLALLVLYLHKQYGYSIANFKRWQDQYCPKYVDNWSVYAKERDEHLTKLLALM